jgi:hypothetical protein
LHGFRAQNEQTAGAAPDILTCDDVKSTTEVPVTVSFTLSPEQEGLKKAARQFAEAHLRDLAEAVRAEPDPARRAELARPVFQKAVEAGFLKGLIPAPFGGAAGSGVDAAILIEEWASHSPDFVISMAGPLIALVPVYQVGTPEQIARFVAPFLADGGAPVAAMAYSEPGGSANFGAPAPAEGVRTIAEPDGDHYVINGQKAWASHLPGWDGDGPDVMTIVCRAPGGVSLVVAEREHLTGHIEVEHLYDLPGLRGCLTARIRLRDVRVPKANLLGAEGRGVELTRNAFVGSGASIGTFSVAAVREDRAPRRRCPDHRASGRLRRTRQREGAHRGHTTAVLARARRGAVRRPTESGMGTARQGARLRHRGISDQRPDPGRRRLGLRQRLPAQALPRRSACLPCDRGLQHRRPAPSDAILVHHARIRPARGLRHVLNRLSEIWSTNPSSG